MNYEAKRRDVDQIEIDISSAWIIDKNEPNLQVSEVKPYERTEKLPVVEEVMEQSREDLSFGGAGRFDQQKEQIITDHNSSSF